MNEKSLQKTSFRHLIPLPFYLKFLRSHIFEIKLHSGIIITMRFLNPEQIVIPPAPGTVVAFDSDKKLDVDDLDKGRLYLNNVVRAYRFITQETYNNGVIKELPYDQFFRIVIIQEIDESGNPIGPPMYNSYIKELKVGTIRQEDYLKIKELADSPKIMLKYLPDELLLRATSFLQEENFRMAILEAVTALEIVVSSTIREFGHKRGISEKKIKKLIRDAGLTGNLDVVLRLLIPDDLPSKDIMSGCKGAIKIRNAIVHEGRLSVSEKEAKGAIDNIRLCYLHVVPL